VGQAALDDENGWRQWSTCKRIVDEPTLPVHLTRAEIYKLYYPTRHSNSAASLAAKTICLSHCPVARQCAESAIIHDKLGIRGGLTANDRRKIRRERGITSRVDDSLDDYLFDDEPDD
jgi:hypothetical protein